MSTWIDTCSAVSLTAGAVFCVIGGIGLLRMPDLYTRAHAASITDTLGAGLVLFGLMLQAGVSMVTVKLVMVLLLLLFTGPAATHALVKAASAHGLRADVPTRGDDLAG